MLLKFRISIALFIVMLGFFGWREVKLRAFINQQNRTIEQAKLNDQKRDEADSLAQIKTARENAELTGLLVIQKIENVRLRDQIFEMQDALQDTTEEGGIVITFKRENPCVKVWGYTVTATEFAKQYAIVHLEGKSIQVERKYREIGGKLYEVIRPMNDCIEFESILFDIPPELPDLLKIKPIRGSPVKPFLIGGAVGSVLVFLFMH